MELFFILEQILEPSKVFTLNTLVFEYLCELVFIIFRKCLFWSEEEWFENLRREKRVGRPPIKWIADWMYKHNASPSRKRLSERQIYRHITALTEASSKNGKPDRPYAEFVTHWYGCEDSRFVDNFTGESLADVILKLFPSAKLDGNDIKPMRDMDAADFADKCDGKFGQKRNYRTHVD